MAATTLCDWRSEAFLATRYLKLTCANQERGGDATDPPDMAQPAKPNGEQVERDVNDEHQTAGEKRGSEWRLRQTALP